MDEHHDPGLDQVADLAAMTAGLRVAVDGLTGTVEALTGAMERVDAQGRRNSVWITMVTLGFVLDILLTVAMTVVVASIVDANHRIQDSLRQNYVTASQQAETRVKVLCPLYTLFLGAAATAQPGEPAAQVEARRAALGTIRAGYQTLGCQPPLPSPSPSSSH